MLARLKAGWGDANPAATGPAAADGHSEPSDDEGRSTLDATPEPSASFSEAQPRHGSSLASDGASSGDEAGPARRSSALQHGRRRSSGLSAQSLGEVAGGGLGQSSVQAPAPPRPRTWEEVRAAAEIARRGLLWARLAATPELGAGLRRLERCLASSAGRGEAEGARREDSGGLGTAGLGPLCRWEDAMPGQAMCSAWHPDRPAILAVGFRDARRQDSPGRVAVYCLSRPGRALWQAGVPHGPSAAAWLPGRGALAVGCAMGTITLFRPRQGGRDAGSPICTVPYGGGHGAPVCALVPAAEAGTCLSSCGKEGTVLHWKGGPEDGLEVGARQELMAPWAAWVTCAAARSPDRAWALGSMEGRLLVAATDQSAPSCSAAGPHPAPLLQLAWHPRRQHVLLSADARGTLAIWSVESAEVCLVWSHSGPVEAAACVAWHPLQGTCFAAGGADGKASVWDLARSTRFPLSTSTLGCPVTTLAWSPDGRALVCGGEAGAITALAWSAPDLTEGGSQDGAEGNDAVLRVLTESRHESSRM
ncbi:putative WD repeat-containing protein C18H10.05 [Auxenochlorella protothecoides]|uniref:Dynein axonemal intermediate chain 4 n=1 Tax=Auxenochlorella protothecoides TaxID=3075 RepID=A0A087SNU6_AUXPR|nr:putative WD repeat-containing protein C18H10.05 [Auxenochlorella protothecoides]KFM27400.1 putative WD repeat-containing protein C18H10.05 [Auxenochlorella protothecoides]